MTLRGSDAVERRGAIWAMSNSLDHPGSLLVSQRNRISRSTTTVIAIEKYEVSDSLVHHLKDKQEEIALWTGVEGNRSIQDGDGTIGHNLTMHIVKSLSIPEGACYACIAHLGPKASEQEEREIKVT